MRYSPSTHAGAYGRALLVSCAVLAACSESKLPSAVSNPAVQKVRDGVVISVPLTPAYSVARAVTASDSQLVYVSMPPGTLSGGDSVRIISPNGAPASGRMIDGGFDPIPVFARVGDSVPVTVFTAASEIGPVPVAVPVTSRPSVVRTTPPKGRTDVPLNQMVVIVFSQPVDPATITSSSIQLTVGGGAVAGTLTVQPDQPWVVRFVPSALLAPNTRYSLSIDASIKDQSGTPLTAPVSTDFTTGTSQADLASIAVFAYGGSYGRPPSNFAVASPGGVVPLTAYKVSSAGDTLTPTTGDAIAWSSADPTVASVNANGIATAVGAGGVAVSACAGAICGAASITVETLPPGIPPLELGNLGGGDSRVYDMKGGNVVGFSKVPLDIGGLSCHHAFLWMALRGMEDLGTFAGGCNSEAWHVSAAGTVLGTSEGAAPPGLNGYFLWKRATGMRTLPVPDQAHQPWYAIGINSNDEIAFQSDSGPGPAIALWSPSTGMHVYPAPAVQLGAVGPNDLGQVAISPYVLDLSTNSVVGCGDTGGYVWNANTGQIVYHLDPRDLTTGQPLTLCVGAINNSGTVAGSVNWPGNTTAFRWTPARGFTYLPTVGPGITTEGEVINDAGDIGVYLISYRHVGTDSLFEGRSAVWLASGQLVLLGGLGGTHTFSNGINNSHLVAGHSQVGSNTGPQHAVIWDLTSVAPLRASKVRP